MSDDQVTLDPNERKALKGMLAEMVECLERIDGEREQLKAIAERAEEEFGLKKKITNRLARTLFKRDYPDVQAENESFEWLYEAVAEGKIVDEG